MEIFNYQNFDKSAVFAGIDIIDISRIERAVAVHGKRFLETIYTPSEVFCCGGNIPSLAVRFAAKEAVSKALGIGLGVGSRSWQEIEVLRDELGKPLLYLHGRADRKARELGLCSFDISLSHEGKTALALVVAV